MSKVYLLALSSGNDSPTANLYEIYRTDQADPNSKVLTYLGRASSTRGPSDWEPQSSQIEFQQPIEPFWRRRSDLGGLVLKVGVLVNYPFLFPKDQVGGILFGGQGDGDSFHPTLEARS